jgi:DNA invertase Pin-like site-specific DNA recombinase
MERVAVYARVSTAAQGDPDATSIEDQLLRTRAYATARDWEVVAEYLDVGVTG